jgi:hypothetical protein
MVTSTIVTSTQNDIFKNITKCKVLKPLAKYGILLNPHLIQDLELREDQDAMAGLMKVFKRLSNTDKDFKVVKVEFN